LVAAKDLAASLVLTVVGTDQQQTIANKKRLEEKDPAARARSNAALRATAADPAAHRAYLLRASLIESVRKPKPA